MSSHFSLGARLILATQRVKSLLLEIDKIEKDYRSLAIREAFKNQKD